MKCLVPLLLFTIVLAQEARYDNYTLHSLIPRTIEQVQKLIELKNIGMPLEFMSAPYVVNNPVDILVPPHKFDEFNDILTRLKMEHVLKSDNMQRLIDESNPPSDSEKFNWKRYHKLEVIYKWMKNIARRYFPYAKLITVGHSYEGRPIRGIKLSFRKGNKAVFIEGGIHAREWIGPATVTFILNQLLTSTDPAVGQLVKSYDWYFVPSVNPDGYTHAHTRNRLWRKTRQPYGLCTGADANRNWGYQWNVTGTTGPCWEFNPGFQAFSEPETKSLSEYISTIGNNLVAYLAMHSYGQLVLIPYATGNHSDNYEEMLQVGKKMVASVVQRHGTPYNVGNWAEILYASSGVSVDWVKKSFNVPFTYTIELRDRGRTGFLLPHTEIIPVGEEIFDGVVTLMTEVKTRGY